MSEPNPNPAALDETSEVNIPLRKQWPAHLLLQFLRNHHPGHLDMLERTGRLQVTLETLVASAEDMVERLRTEGKDAITAKLETENELVYNRMWADQPQASQLFGQEPLTPVEAERAAQAWMDGMAQSRRAD